MDAFSLSIKCAGIRSLHLTKRFMVSLNFFFLDTELFTAQDTFFFPLEFTMNKMAA